MTYFRGRLINDQGKVTAARVSGDYEQRSNTAGTTYWFGQFAVPTGETVSPGDYRLVLDDGCSARVRVSDGTYHRGRPGVVRFSGQGPLLSAKVSLDAGKQTVS